MLLLIRSLFLVAVCSVAVLSQTSIFNSKGKPFDKVAKKTMQPKVIVDTVDILNGFGYLVLEKGFNRSKQRTAPTGTDNIRATVTQLLTDTAATVYYYGYVVTTGGDTLKIVSSGGASDDGKVVVVAYVK